jgi:predicted transcriptional regulator
MTKPLVITPEFVKEVERLFHEEKLTFLEIAETLNVPISRIRKVMDEYATISPSIKQYKVKPFDKWNFAPFEELSPQW